MALRKATFIFIIITATIVAAPFMLTVAGDAQVHLAIAENFGRGLPFQYNPGGEIVVASTSPFWTILLILFYMISGSWAPLFLKVAVSIAWLAVAYLLYKASRDLWHFSPWLILATLALWLTHTVVVANALSGLENILSAVQLLLLYLLTAEFGPRLTPKRSALLGLLFGWMILTRPDGALLAIVLLSNFALVLILNAQHNRMGVSAAFRKWLPLLAVFIFATLIVLLPWYLYQWSITGKIITDSSLARLYSGRQGSIPLGSLFFHPKATISLATAFLPLAAGALLFGFHLLRQFFQARQRARFWIDNYARTTALLLLSAGYHFYSFIVGAESFGRYFLPLYPYLFLSGIAGLALLFDWLRGRWLWVAYAFVVGTILFMVTASAYDFYRRLGPGRFDPEQVLDVIYGPAHLQYYSPNLWDLIQAPARRQSYTDELIAGLELTSNTASIAVTEVQLRYFLDERVEILSLDGRTSANTLTYFDPKTGVPDFDAFLRRTQPDYIHVNQWCAVGGWLASFRPVLMEDNLICHWQQQSSDLSLGEQFTWQGHKLTLVAPEIIHIDWES